MNWAGMCVHGAYASSCTATATADVCVFFTFARRIEFMKKQNKKQQINLKPLKHADF